MACQTQNNNKGFTLVEIMIVVSIIATLAALSISMMLRNRMTANETLTIANCRTIVSACQSYYANVMPHTYPANLTVLGNVTPRYIDTTLSQDPAVKSGYSYIYQRIDAETFTLNANPTTPGRTGNRYFYSDETGRTTAKEGGQAGPTDPSIS